MIEGVMWIDGYNNAVHKDWVTTLKTNIDTSNIYFFNDPRPKDEANSDEYNARWNVSNIKNPP